MKEVRGQQRANARRLSEIQAGHGFLRMVFPESQFQAEEFAKALHFVRRTKASEVVPAASVVRRLVRWYEDGNPGVACRVLDAGAFSGGMLWIQVGLGRVIRDLSRGSPAVLLITGLCEAVRAPGHRWTKRAERERQENLQLLEDQVRRWSETTGTPISLLVA